MEKGRNLDSATISIGDRVSGRQNCIDQPLRSEAYIRIRLRPYHWEVRKVVFFERNRMKVRHSTFISISETAESLSMLR